MTPDRSAELCVAGPALAEVAAQIIGTRRTVHDFAPRAVPREIISAGLALALRAPNHHLTQPWHFSLLGPRTAEAMALLNADQVRARSGDDAARLKLERWRAVSGWLLVTCDRDADPVREREDYAACCCAIQNLQLYLWAHGVGMKWTTGAVTRMPEFFALAGIDPEQQSVVGLLWYGYPADDTRTPRRPLESCLRELP